MGVGRLPARMTRSGLPGGVAKLVCSEQIAANRSGLPHFELFASHRRRLTDLVVRAAESSSARLCVLGAGNGYDLDLPRLLEAFKEIHLVDLDKQALEGLKRRIPPERQADITVHAPVDLSGILARLRDWKERRLDPEQLIRWPYTATERIVNEIGQNFDVVASTCVLSQMQLGLVQALGETHPFFQAARFTVNVAHLRTLCRLLAPGGRAVLATDVASDLDCDFTAVSEADDLRPLLRSQATVAKMMDMMDPELLHRMFLEDPLLSQRATLSEPVDAWLWRNGPDRTFLVYAVELRLS